MAFAREFDKFIVVIVDWMASDMAVLALWKPVCRLSLQMA